MYNVPKDVQRWVLVRCRRNERYGCRQWWRVLGGVLLPRERDDSNWRRDGWRLPDWSVQHRGWNNLNDICVHAVPRGDLRLCDHAGDGGVLGHVHCRILLPFRFRVC